MAGPVIRFLGHATTVVEVAGFRVLTDPVLRDRLAHLHRVSGARADVVSLADPARVDAVVISHLHHDHADVPSLRMLPRDLPVMVPEGAGAFFARLGFTQVHPLVPGATWALPAPAGRSDPLRITATAAVHHGHRVPFGPRAESVGYLIEAGPASVYFAGDTDVFPAMAEIHPRLDVALLPVWGWGPNLGPGHMDPARAAQALALLRPRAAVPIHWGTFFPVGLRRLGRRFGALLEEPPREFAAAAGRAAPECRVVIVRPGEVVEFSHE